ncbi:macrolide transport system ATP-binding/permease protein [Arthrobacter sp. yr096]|uniref:ABC transporter ATP-binding protein/permease n=1 Tax=Arthrobacter sp. yr096 TaxID=1761750 RepID=UPI0008B5EA7C|nr:ATP-binding cassette domain-containing protein [Arthrobacter sp. yr096]SEJ02388.1 macrolide transport system ATP-binding/permease protein [Arthrobacter sp. yr096]
MSTPVSSPRSPDPEQRQPILSLRAVDRLFSGAKALDDVSLDIQEGEFVAIVGPSGSGKSTLLNILGLLDTPTRGVYLIDGADVQGLNQKQRAQRRADVFGFVFQESHMVGRDAAARNAVLGLRARGIGIGVQKQLVIPALARFGLAGRAAIPAALLSGGERQRLAIARAVMGTPRVVLADEPTGSLDTANGEIVIHHLRELSDSGTTVAMVTHDPDIAKAADRIITMRDGAIVKDTGEHRNRLVIPKDSVPVRGKDKPTFVRHRRHEAADVIADALSALTVRPAKALLLIMAFLLGSGGLVAAIGLSESASVKVSARIDAAARDEVRVTREGGYASWEAVRNDLQASAGLFGVHDAGVIAELSSSVVQPSTFRPATFPEQPIFNGAVRVVDSAYLRLQGATVSFGDAALLDQSFGGPVAILGREAADQLGAAKPGPGVVVWLYGQPVPVVGIIDDPGRDPVLPAAVLVGIGSYPSASNVAASLVLRTTPGMPAAIAEALPKALQPSDPGNVKVQTVADLRELRQGINSDLGRLVAIVSVVLLAMACLSAGTTMYLGVLTRSSEIALRLALGMRRGVLASMFVTEGAVVGALGGAAGAAVGMGAVLAYASSQGWASAIPWYASLWGVGAGLASGILSAVYPAVLAMQSNPAQLIRA